MSSRLVDRIILLGTIFISCCWASGLRGENSRWYEERPHIMSVHRVDGSEPEVDGARASTPNAGDFTVLHGFQIERLFTVPKEELGSWVCLTNDDKGRLLVSDQDKHGICRITPAPLGNDNPTRVEHLAVPISSAQGMLFAFGSLYLSVNAGSETGLYRIRDTNGDDQFDEVVKLKSFPNGGEHGLHALKLSPDHKSICILCGDHTDPPFSVDEARNHSEFTSCVPANWGEDLLLPRQWDPGGHACGRMAPAGWLAQTDADGKNWRMFSVGHRNAYDMDFNVEGECFTYDSDMEGDMGLPWYRPTRICHTTSGSEFGCRSGTGKWPIYYPDSLPPTSEIGPGSPTGVTFGYNARFPAKYQKALFVCDWTFGTIYAMHLEPKGSTYRAQKEEFLSRSPLPLTDIVVGTDGALYFIIGGRNTQSELYRVTYVGDESTQETEFVESHGAGLRRLRRKLETYHGRSDEDPSAAVDFIWPYLSHEDRFIRYAARVALEFQPPEHWQERLLANQEPATLITGAVALARQGDKALQQRLLDALGRLVFARLPESQQLAALRAYQLVLIRMGNPSDSLRRQLAEHFDALYPAPSDALNRELCDLLVYLHSPAVIPKTLTLLAQDETSIREKSSALIDRNPTYGSPIAEMWRNLPSTQKIHYAFSLRNVKDGWTLAQRKEYFGFLRRADKWSGGHSFRGYLQNIDREAFDNASENERLAVEASGIRTPFRLPELPQPQGPQHEWTADEVRRLVSEATQRRDFENGRRMYAAARCIVCHRFNGEGGSLGPDLTQAAGRFGVNDLIDSIFDPSKVIPDQFRATVVCTTNGLVYTGRVVFEDKQSVTLIIHPEDPTQTVVINRDDIELLQLSSTSTMPQRLLTPLGEREVLDLFAYLLSRGNPQSPMYSSAEPLRKPDRDEP